MIARRAPRREQLWRWLPAVSWGVLISAFSTGTFSGDNTAALIVPVLSALFPHASPAELAAMHQTIRKLAHFAEYLVLSVLLYRALRGGQRWSPRAALVSLSIAGLYSVADEMHQYFVPGRTAAATDCLIDVSGAAAGQGLLAFSWRAARAG